jgi:hypothetical protein
MSLVVAAVDVGSLANIGWWRADGDAGAGGHDLDVLVEQLVADLNAGIAVALGFEAPLFIPRPSESSQLNKQRLGDRGRPWCAGAGTGALALGIQQATYVLSAIARDFGGGLAVGFDCAALESGAAQLVLWEAFVSGKSKNRAAFDPHVDDARVAVVEFHARFASGLMTSDVDDVDVLNLAAAALLATGLTDDIALLTQPCAVVRAPDFVAGVM